MIKGLQVIKKLISTKTAIILMIPVLMFATLAIPAGSLGAFGPQMASAADPRGDWNIQFRGTMLWAGAKCFEYEPYLGTCVSGFYPHYVTSGSWDAETRYFVWSVRWEKTSCIMYVTIKGNQITNWWCQ